MKQFVATAVIVVALGLSAAWASSQLSLENYGAACEDAKYILGFIIGSETSTRISLGALLVSVAACWFTVQSSRRQLRAYVMLGETWISNEGPLRFRFKLKNCGSTPARQVITTVSAEVHGKMSEPAKGFETVVSGVLFPEQEHESVVEFIHVMNEADHEGIRNVKERAFVFSGEARYIDIYNTCRVTKFRVGSQGYWESKPRLVLMPSGNDWT